MFPFRKKREEERIAYLVTRGGNNHFAVNSSFRHIRLIHSASIEPKGKNCPGNGGGQGTDGDIFARDREARGRGGGSLCLFRSAFTSRLYFLSPSSSSPSLVFGVLSASVAASCFLFCHRYLPPSGPDEINDGINDTALNAGDQPVNRLDRFHPRVPTFRPK